MNIIQRVLVIATILGLAACGGGGGGSSASNPAPAPAPTPAAPTAVQNATAATSGAVAVSM